MTTTNDIAGRVFAAFGAIAITATLLVSSFANPTTTSAIGMLA